MIVELGADRTVRLADRSDAIQPKNAKVSQVRRVLAQAGSQFDNLMKLWEDAHA